MASSFTQDVLFGLRTVESYIATFNSITLTFACGAVAWLIWRVWAFTILPALRPNEPKQVPYWIPCEQSANLLICETLKYRF